MRASVAAPERSKKLDRAFRKCLGCGVSFRSEWIGNRQCPTCKNTGNRGGTLGEEGQGRARRGRRLDE